jgi:hypothetical protein
MTTSDMKPQRVQLTNHIMQLLDSWGVNGDQKKIILGLPEDMRTRKLERYRQDEVFPDTDQINQHIEHILGIADALRTSFPRNIEMCARWMKQPHKRFNNEPPISVMVDKGLAGLIQVRSQLDCSFAWHTSGSSV